MSFPILFALTLALGAAASGAANAPSPRAELLRARTEASEAGRRSRALEVEARRAGTRAARARAAQAAAVARIAAAEAGISAAEARIRIIESQRSAQRVRLAAEERPIVPLVAALQTMARRPPALTLVHRGSIQQLVHTRALLASTLPVIAERTRGLRAELALAKRIERQSAQAAASLRASRGDLDRQRGRLAAIERVNLRRSQSFFSSALDEGDRALSLREDARGIVSESRQRRDDDALAASLSVLPGPVLLPGIATPSARQPVRPRYLLPVEGRLVTGAGEISDAGVHARGLTLATASGAGIIAPAAGRIAYAARFRSFGMIVIIDHGGGWTTLVTNLAALDIAAGQRVARGDALGRAGVDRPEITVELRHGGRPVPITPLLGSS